MPSHVIATIEIDGDDLGAYTSIQLFQEFNAHHELTITVPFTALEQRTATDIITTKDKIGKPIIVRLKHDRTLEDLLAFRGILTEVRYELGDNYTRNLVLKSYDPTILLETGPDLRSFLDKDLPTIVREVLQPVADFGVTLELDGCSYPNPTPYLCQYKESAFNFLNRLSVDYIQPFFYNGVRLFYGHYDPPTVELIYGVDLDYFQVAYKVLPLKFSKYSYSWNEHRVVREDAPTSLDMATWGNISQTLFTESHNLFGLAVQSVISQNIDELSDIATFTKYEEAQRATNIKTISGHSVDTELQLGKKIVVKVPLTDASGNVTYEEQGSYFVTSVKHFVGENGSYYNTFEGVTTEVRMLPLHNAVHPQVEVEFATVMDNADPEHKGRVKVQTPWQARNNETTNWIKVLTPDAGQGRNGGGNRGLVVIPEVGDLVLIYFGEGDPKRPFVMGSMFSGRTAGGGGQGNRVKSLTALSGANVTINGTVITIDDAEGDTITFNAGDIKIKAATSVHIEAPSLIELKCGASLIKLEPAKILVQSTDIKVNATAGVDVQGASKAVLKQADGNAFKAEGNNAIITGTKVDAAATGEMKVGGSTVKVSGSGIVEIKGSPLNMNC